MCKKDIVIEARPYLLANKIQHYAWGAKDEDAFIPRFLGIEAEPDIPYAELWMGTHPNAPSDVIIDENTAIPLGELIDQAPQGILGKSLCKKFSGKLPFLFKILSIADALSIQVHPNKEQAELLHVKDPEHYPDDNHKPEIAIALESLTALVGFKSFPEMLQTLEEYPEIADFIGTNARDSVKSIYSIMVEKSTEYQDMLIQCIDRLAKRLSSSTNNLNEPEKLFLDLREKYTGADIGLFSIFLFNLVYLKKGQGVFLPARIPHAYLKGNIIECMANSDNVVRVGLTPKFKDAETLVNVLNYEPKPISIMEGMNESGEVEYQPPVSEFQIRWWKLDADEERNKANANKLEILLVTEGEISIGWGNEESVFRKGQSILIPSILRDYTIKGTAELFLVDVP